MLDTVDQDGCEQGEEVRGAVLIVMPGLDASDRRIGDGPDGVHWRTLSFRETRAMTITDQPQSLQQAWIDKERLRQKYLEERNKRLRADGNDQYLRSPASSPTISTIPTRRSCRARRRPTTSPSPSSAAASPGSPPPRGCRRPASRTSASSRRAAISAAPGTGTAIPARSATRRRWSTCRCSKRPATCRPRNTRMRRKSSRIASASASNTASTTTRCFTPRSRSLEWDEAQSRW